MPEIWIWGILASVIMIAFVATLKAAGFRFELKMADQVITRLWKEIDTLNERNNQSISNKRESDMPEIRNPTNKIHNKEPFHKILTAIAKYDSQKIPATPIIIAKEINLDPEITLAYMWKYHNDQFISFHTRGEKPGIKTPFFLSPKALNEIKIIKK